MPQRPRTRLTREESQEQTRRRLIEAACAEVARRGFAAASVRDIAEAAGYSQGAFYSNFASKEALMLEMMHHHKATETAGVEAFLDAAGGDAAVAMAGLEKWAAAFRPGGDRAVLAAELELHAKRNESFAVEYDALIEDNRAALGKLVARLFHIHGLEPPAPPKDLAMGLIAMMRGMALTAKPDDTMTPGAMIMTFIRSLLASGTAPPR